jgi:ketosteroid isomerase-like protein
VAPADTAADRKAALAVVHRLFDAMRAGDSAGVRAVFHPQAQLATAATRQGAPMVEFDTIDVFVRAVGTPHTETWDERLRGETVHLDGGLASVWAEYSFYAGQRFSHCGVDSFHLARTADGWKIIGIVDTRRRQGCPDK